METDTLDSQTARASLASSGDHSITHWQKENLKFINRKYAMKGILPGRGEIWREKSREPLHQQACDQGHHPAFPIDPDHPWPLISLITLTVWPLISSAMEVWDWSGSVGVWSWVGYGFGLTRNQSGAFRVWSWVGYGFGFGFGKEGSPDSSNIYAVDDQLEWSICWMLASRDVCWSSQYVAVIAVASHFRVEWFCVSL